MINLNSLITSDQEVKLVIEPRKRLSETVHSKYRNYKHKGSEWSDTVVNTMRSGFLSRLNDLGLVKRKKYGKYVSYHITDAGRRYIQRLSKKDEVTKNYQGQSEVAA